METAIAAPPVPFTAVDRCDSCAAQAHVRATFPSGFVLEFCMHHGNEKEDALVLQGAAIYKQPVGIRVNDTDH